MIFYILNLILKNDFENFEKNIYSLLFPPGLGKSIGALVPVAYFLQQFVSAFVFCPKNIINPTWVEEVIKIGKIYGIHIKFLIVKKDLSEKQTIEIINNIKKGGIL
jgi:hypothetical protein